MAKQMTVQEVIDELNKVEDKSKHLNFYTENKYLGSAYKVDTELPVLLVSYYEGEEPKAMTELRGLLKKVNALALKELATACDVFNEPRSTQSSSCTEEIRQIIRLTERYGNPKNIGV